MSSVVNSPLTVALADTYIVYLKTHAYHWNVVGPSFKSLHELFEEQYTDMWTAIDEIAERIRALGEFAPVSYAAMAKVATVEEETEVPKAETMVKRLVKDNESLVHTLRQAFNAAEDQNDDVTADMMIERIRFHEKQIWMMKSFLG